MAALTEKQEAANEKLFGEIRDTWPLRRGKREFLDALAPGSISRGDAIIAQCYHCCGGYEDGPYDCMESICPLYQYMPYRDKSDREAMPEEAKAQLIARFEAGRIAKQEREASL